MTFEVLTSDKYTGAQYLPLKEKQILRTEKKKKKKKPHCLCNSLILVKGFSFLLSYI